MIKNPHAELVNNIQASVDWVDDVADGSGFLRNDFTGTSKQVSGARKVEVITIDRRARYQLVRELFLEETGEVA